VDIDYRDLLFSNYQKTHVHHLDSEDSRPKLEWFNQYVRLNYLPYFQGYAVSDIRVLEIGCNKGFLMAALASLGFRRLTGIDLSPDDIQVAKRLVPEAELLCTDAESHLEQENATYDFIILKAVLEHVRKDEVVPFLMKIRNALKDNGLIIIDVPNMDWLMAQHERYMDFTHEVGFTRESLAQVMRNVFRDVQIRKARAVGESRRVEFVRPFVLKCMNWVFRIVGEGSSDVWWDCRSIIAVARK
jgi:2-polyprenyl-3-methyl-5-hydroxy-6-metoxy-1,4-benzoquinol methylase